MFIHVTVCLYFVLCKHVPDFVCHIFTFNCHKVHYTIINCYLTSSTTMRLLNLGASHDIHFCSNSSSSSSYCFRRLLYVRRSSTHWTLNSGNWLVDLGVGMVELIYTLSSAWPRTLREIAGNLLPKLGAYCRPLLAAEMPFQSPCSSMSLLMSLAAHSGEDLGVLIPSQLSSIVIS